jgi:predicted nucleic acid-binding protein
VSTEDTLGGFVLDTSALAALGGGENIYATTWADRAAMRGIVLLVPAGALSEAWQQIRRHGPGHVEQMRELLASPMVLVEPLEETKAAQAGELVEGRDLTPDVAAAQVATCARARDWPVLAAQPARRRVIDPELTVETLPGMP